MTAFTDLVFSLIRDEEGLDQPSRWPGEQSGITLGPGWDLGYHSRAELREAWGRHLPASDLAMLDTAVGVRGLSAKAIAPRFVRIKITREQADEVLTRCVVPVWIETTRRAFPGYESLPAQAAAALVSLVYNRGPGMGDRKNPKDWDRRREMRAIRDAVLRRDLHAIAAELRSMRRLWPASKGLRDRREREARMVENAA